MNIIFSVVYSIGFCLLLLLLFRLAVLWYWKIDTIVSLLERIANALEKEDKIK